MGKTKNTGGGDNDPKPRTGYPVFARIPDDLGELLDTFLEAQPYQVTLASFLKKAIQEQLAREGYKLATSSRKGGGQ